MDLVRVLRVMEYVGPRDQVEKCIARSITGTRRFQDYNISVVTIGTYPEILGTVVNEQEVEGTE